MEQRLQFVKRRLRIAKREVSAMSLDQVSAISRPVSLDSRDGGLASGLAFCVAAQRRAARRRLSDGYKQRDPGPHRVGLRVRRFMGGS